MSRLDDLLQRADRVLNNISQPTDDFRIGSSVPPIQKNISQVRKIFKISLNFRKSKHFVSKRFSSKAKGYGRKPYQLRWTYRRTNLIHRRKRQNICSEVALPVIFKFTKFFFSSLLWGSEFMPTLRIPEKLQAAVDAASATTAKINEIQTDKEDPSTDTELELFLRREREQILVGLIEETIRNVKCGVTFFLTVIKTIREPKKIL